MINMEKIKKMLPFIIMGMLFVLSCILSNYYYNKGSVTGQYWSWAITVVPVIIWLVYIRIKNK